MTTLADRITHLHNYLDERLNTVDDALTELKGLVNQLAVNEQAFDVDLQALLTAITTLISIPAVVNLSAEDAQVKAALAQIQAAGGPTPTPTP